MRLGEVEQSLRSLWFVSRYLNQALEVQDGSVYFFAKLRDLLLGFLQSLENIRQRLRDVCVRHCSALPPVWVQSRRPRAACAKLLISWLGATAGRRRA